ncbi:MAG TPA: iron-sulfur cluster insertion protein ErpA [Candidatus Paceibacterota bacterium]
MAETSTESVQSPITITPRATEKLCEVMRDDDKDPKKDALRIFVQGGGCSGFQYGLMINEESGPADTHFESNGIKIVVDLISIRYINGAEVDFSEDKGGFSVKNPNAKSTCGCGSSFNTE